MLPTFNGTRAPEPDPNPCFVTVHHQDFDWRTTLHPRQQSIIVFDEQNRLLDAVWLGKTDKGVYTTFPMPSDSGIRIRSIKHRGACVALSGFFVDTHYSYLPPTTPFRAPDAHIRKFLKDVPEPLRALASDFLYAEQGLARLYAARRLLASPCLMAKENLDPASLAVAALAVDASFAFEAVHPRLVPAICSMDADALCRLVYHLCDFSTTPRWAYIIVFQLLERIPGLKTDEARLAFKAIFSILKKNCIRACAQGTVDLWMQLNMPENAPEISELQRKLAPVEKTIKYHRTLPK